MVNLMVLAFAQEVDAVQTYDRLFELKQAGLLQPADAVFVVRRPDGKMKVKHETRLADNPPAPGLLLDFVYWLSWQEMVLGAERQAPAGLQRPIGVADDFVKEISRTIASDHAALFLLVGTSPQENMMTQLHALEATILQTSLSAEEEATLRAVFGR